MLTHFRQTNKFSDELSHFFLYPESLKGKIYRKWTGRLSMSKMSHTCEDHSQAIFVRSFDRFLATH